MNVHPFAHLLWILPLALLAVYVGSPRFLGTAARSRVHRLLGASLDRRRYSTLVDLVLPAGGGTLHFDVVVVSRFGIFVIDAIRRRGRISGTPVQPQWVEKGLGRSRRFDNPVHANFLRVQALERLLGLQLSQFHGLVAVSGPDRLDPKLPGNVVTVRQLPSRVRSEQRLKLEPEAADRAVQTLRERAVRPGWRESGRAWKWVRIAMLLVLACGSYAVYRTELHELAQSLQRQADRRMAPDNFRADGTPKSEVERWEDSLACSYSIDTGRCACYEPAGGRAEIAPDRCRELAERGSILRR